MRSNAQAIDIEAISAHQPDEMREVNPVGSEKADHKAG